MNDFETIRKVNEIINASDNIVFFGGAGVSTESGIRDFRGKNGIYTTMKNDDPKSTPEYLLSAGCLAKEPERFFESMRQNMDFRNIEPNITHKFLKALEDEGKLKAIVTQNIDGLHQKAGCKNVFEIHGTMSTWHCMECEKEYNRNLLFESEGVPKCECGGVIRPDVVLYGEMLPQSYAFASYYILKADVMIVAGTSLQVQPANGLLKIYQGKHLIIINDAETPFDSQAELVMHVSLGEVFGSLMEIRYA